MEGTYPLPEAQLDRFFFKLLVKFPTAERDGGDPRPDDRGRRAPRPSRSSTAGGSSSSRSWPGRSRSPTSCGATAIALVLATHPENSRATEMARRYVRYGSSPRGAQAIILAAKIRAILDHRYHVAREDLRAVAHAALRHRLILNFEGQAEDIQADDIIDDLLRVASPESAVAA